MERQLLCVEAPTTCAGEMVQSGAPVVYRGLPLGGEPRLLSSPGGHSLRVAGRRSTSGKLSWSLNVR
jgi:hypothetical protein